MALPTSAPDRQEAHSLQAVLFLPGHQQFLLEDLTKSPFRQLDGTIELLDFANSYVLNDTTAICGITNPDDCRDEVSRFAQAEAEKGNAIRSIGSRTEDHFKIAPFEQAVGLPALIARFRELESVEASWDEINRVGEQSRVLQAQSHILLADSIKAAYVPERRYGYQALSTYAKLVRASPHVMLEAFRERLLAELSELHTTPDVFQVSVPCFLVEAVRNSRTKSDVCRALADLRQSTAAKKYRNLARRANDETLPIKERLDATRELQATADAVFSSDGFKTRVPRTAKILVGLSSAAISVLFPMVGVVPVLLEVAEEIDKWLQRRANIFDLYAKSLDVDLFKELKRLFPHLSYDAPHLAHFLKTRNFGWPDDLR